MKTNGNQLILVLSFLLIVILPRVHFFLQKCLQPEVSPVTSQTAQDLNGRDEADAPLTISSWTMIWKSSPPTLSLRPRGPRVDV